MSKKVLLYDPDGNALYEGDLVELSNAYVDDEGRANFIYKLGYSPHFGCVVFRFRVSGKTYMKTMYDILDSGIDFKKYQPKETNK